MSNLRQTVKTLLPRPLLQKARAAAWGLGDLRHGLRTGEWGLPPAYLRVKVSGTIPPDNYRQNGEHDARVLVKMLAAAGADPARVETVLDFGCGCGRVIAAAQALLPSAHFCGTDAESDLIGWASAHLRPAEFSVNAPEPPLGYADNRFDFIYAISVFTHLDERLQFAWLDELSRVAKPGAILILTVHGGGEENTFEFVRNTAWSDFFPDYYQTTFHGRAYVAEKWTRGFTLVDYVPHAIGEQDAVVLRKL